MRVGIRELRDRLKHYVATARSGEDVIITDRGRPVARLWRSARSDPSIGSSGRAWRPASPTKG